MANVIKFKKLEEMILTLSDINKGATFMGVYIETFPIKKKSSPFYGQLIKRAFYNVQVNFDWENAVNNQRKKEGKDPDFISKKGNSPFERIGRSCLQKHKKTGEIYLRLRVKYAGPPSYFLNGRQVLDVEELDKIQPDLPVVYPNTKQKLEKEVVMIRPNIKSIKAITVNHETYICQG